MKQASGERSLPLFPLQTVLFPDGLLVLKVFEARYLDLMGECLRTGHSFGVVALRQGSEVKHPEGEPLALETVGCTAQLLDVDSPRPGILLVRCRGGQRFRLRGQRMQASGLWVGDVEMLPPDPLPAAGKTPLEAAQGEAGLALGRVIEALRQDGAPPFLEPLRFEDAGWVANRWCEILPLPLAARQRLMELEDPQGRLQLVDRFLRETGILH